jgi:hypothetical protein
MPESLPIRVVDPVGIAFEHMKVVLFRPFDFGRWFTIGFCAWLATLGQGGCSSTGNVGNTQSRFQKAKEHFPQAQQWVGDNLSWIIPVGIALVVIAFVVWILMIWVSSRGKFMFVHCVSQNRAEVHVPWSTYAMQGNSLFKFRLVMCFTAWAAFIFAFVLLGILIYSMVANKTAPPGRILGASCLGLGVIVLGVSLVVVMKLTTDFVVPIMMLRRTTCLAAWKEFSGLFQAHLGAFVLYLLFCFLLSIVVGLLVFCFAIVTCCIGALLMAIPYIGTVILLPVLVFLRAYSLQFLAQFGPQYNVMTPPSV